MQPQGHVQVLLNLVINAEDAMPDGGLLTIKTENFVVEAAPIGNSDMDINPGRYVLLSVNDSGKGVPSDLLPKVFDPFFTTKGISDHSGLGLSMVHGFMTQSGGDVKITSEPGFGTSLKLYFPALPSASNLTLEGKELETSGQFTGARILVAEDREDVLAVLSRSLRALGHEVLAAANGEEALQLFQDTCSVDLLVTDVVMPGDLQGPLLARHLRKIERDLPVIFLSGYADDVSSNANASREEGIWLMKPVERSALFEAVRVALSGRRLRG